MARPTPVRAGLVAAVAAGTTWVATTSWEPFVTDPSPFLGRLAVVAVVVAALGAALRASGTPRALVTPVQTVVAAAVVCQLVTGSFLVVGPGGSAMLDALRAGVDSARTYAAPVGPSVAPVWPLLLAGGAVFVVLVDAVAGTYRRAAASGLALLAVYAVPSGLDAGTSGIVGFAVAAVGYSTLLHLDHLDRAERWGRRVGPQESALWRYTESVRDASRAGAGRIALGATAVALLAPLLLPGAGLRLLDGGAGTGDGDIRIRKPVADMRRDLVRGADVPLVRLTTDDPDPSYLRISVLNRYTGEEWSSGDRDVARADRADGPLPAPPGLDADVPREEYDYRVEATRAFDSTWLPTTYPAAAVSAAGDWRFDPASLDFLAADDDLDTRGLSYRMTALRPQYGTDGRHFRDSTTNATDVEVRELPPVPEIVERLATRVTERATDDYGRALLLQRWFRQDGGFRYDLRRSPDGTGNDTLAAFLAPSGRVGYCEQYASAMAVMARSLGIPARLAVGFLRPTRLPDGRWEYSSHDLHAWPELYFSGAGWVRFEPTPAGRARETPDYTEVPVDGASTAPELPEESIAPEDGSSGPAPTTAPDPRAEDAARDADGSGGLLDTGTLLIGGGVLVVVLLAAALAVGPRTVREARRRSRRAGGPEDAWAEIAATAADLGRPWLAGRSPREQADALAGHLGDPTAPPAERPRTGPDVAPEATAALERLLRAVERGRYARPGAAAAPSGGRTAVAERADVGTDLDLVLAALEAGVGPRARRRAARWPRSLRPRS